jgi:hypothetical protein
MNLDYLNASLPPGSRNFFTPRQYGNHIGVPCICTLERANGEPCGQRPPSDIPSWNRWRWMMAHTRLHAAGKLP